MHWTSNGALLTFDLIALDNVLIQLILKIAHINGIPALANQRAYHFGTLKDYLLMDHHWLSEAVEYFQTC